ncbi:MAG: phosphate ABC transporter substrate-binding protein PstS [Actinomycetales bacterium]|nr:phosphate ABC transporter substrate-binding protein PstS [Actinomycetales bacterium]
MKSAISKIVTVSFATVLGLSTATVAIADTPTIQGAGSTWSQIAVDQWRADVKSKLGLKVNFTGSGSSAGRSLYVAGKVDFAVTEIPFSKEGDAGVVAGQAEVTALEAAKKTYQYFPIVAGGTALMYNLKDSTGKQITNLQLSPETIAQIFTGKIKNWSDPKIAQDNGGNALPSLAITPVVRSDGSGTSAQFSAFLAKQENGIWAPFAQSNGIPTTVGTSNYPVATGFVGQTGSDGVANYVANRSTGVGAIGYVETGYAVQRGFPVAAVKNKAGKYVLPTPENVSIALQAARLNPDNTQILTGVYNNTNPNAYPISSYSYMVTNKDTGLPADKGAVLSQYVKYFACEGQQKAAVLGYAPLPPVLVQVVFDAITHIPGHIKIPAKPTAENCANPTFKGKLGAGANNAGTSGTGGFNGTGSGTGTNGTGSGTGTTGSGTGTGTNGSGTGTNGSGTITSGGQISNESQVQAVEITVSPQGSSVVWPAALVFLIILGPAIALGLYRRLSAGN